MKIVNEHIQYPDIEYEAPNTTGYIHLTAEIERTLPIKPNRYHSTPDLSSKSSSVRAG